VDARGRPIEDETALERIESLRIPQLAGSIRELLAARAAGGSSATGTETASATSADAV
jgi:hypothetical protein